MPALQTLPAGSPVSDIMAVLNRDGALILSDMIAPDALAHLNAELKPYIDATAPGQDSFTGTHTTRTGALVARSPACRELIMNAAIRALCDAFLLPNCERYQLHLAQVIRIMPGQGAQMIHRDRWAWGTWLKGLEPQLNTIWALTDFTKENGATQVCPGSLGWDDSYKPSPNEIGYAEMKAGSVLVYSGTVFHGGGANVTADRDRIGLNITYALGWLRQEENQYLACPPDIARTLDPELAQLIGYAMGQYALGYYSPPLPPGAGPEHVSPDFALHGGAAKATLGDLDATRAKRAKQEAAAV